MENNKKCFGSIGVSENEEEGKVTVEWLIGHFKTKKKYLPFVYLGCNLLWILLPITKIYEEHCFYGDSLLLISFYSLVLLWFCVDWLRCIWYSWQDQIKGKFFSK